MTAGVDHAQPRRDAVLVGPGGGSRSGAVPAAGPDPGLGTSGDAGTGDGAGDTSGRSPFRLVPVRRPRTLAGVGLGRAIAVESCALVIYAMWPWHTVTRAAVAGVAGLAVPLILLGVPGGRLVARIGWHIRSRVRRRVGAVSRDDVAIRRFVDRAGVVHAALHHDGCWTALLAVGEARRMPGVATPVPGIRLALGELAAALDDRGVRLAALRLVGVEVPWDAVAARRRVYLAAALHPEDCPQAVAARGGGDEGAHRALASAVARLATRLRGDGVRVRVLDPPDALLAVRTARQSPAPAPSPGPPPAGAASDPARDPAPRTQASARAPAAARGEEAWTSWTVDGHSHVAYHVVRWPRSADPLAALGAVTTGPGNALVTSVTLRPAGPGVETGGTVTLDAVVRLVCPIAERADAERALLRTAREQGLRLRRADGRHRSMASASGLLVGVDR